MGGKDARGRFVPGAGISAAPRVSELPTDKAVHALGTFGRDVHGAVRELSLFAQAADARAERAEAAAPRVFKAIALQDGKETSIAHRLGARPSFVRDSCPRGVDPSILIASTGRVVLVPSLAAAAPYDETKYVVLRADGWGVDIVVDVMVVP